jgi:trehalose 6-phosphate synthase/phosphatase
MKLIIVSNRHAAYLVEKEGSLEFAQSPGGLTSVPGLPRVSGGRALPRDREVDVMRHCREGFSARPVFLTAENTECFYEGYCNQTLWPLFHYFSALASFDEDPWATYELFNELFCDAVLEEAGPDDTVWVNDYHLLLLPAMLRARRPGLKVGFFLHIPFPSYELFRLLPDR